MGSKLVDLGVPTVYIVDAGWRDPWFAYRHGPIWEMIVSRQCHGWIYIMQLFSTGNSLGWDQVIGEKVRSDFYPVRQWDSISLIIVIGVVRLARSKESLNTTYTQLAASVISKLDGLCFYTLEHWNITCRLFVKLLFSGDSMT